MGFALIPLLSATSSAATTITVNSNTDTTTNDGVCTLREAITASNTDTASGAAAGECAAGSGVDTINFNITGAADFTNGGQSGYTIKPQAALPDISETVTIDGYSQPGSSQNTTVSPNPFDAVLLVELDGSERGGSYFGFSLMSGSDGSTIKGLSVNNFDSTDALHIESENTKIQGNYIGTNVTATAAKPNGVGLNGTGGSSLGEGALIGGLSPEDRNIISGNSVGSTATGAYPSNNWTFQGNYIGLGADGLTQIGNSSPPPLGPGALSIDSNNGVTVGGSQVGAMNVISGNKSFGIFPDDTTNLVIQGNIIGADWRGDAFANPVQLGGIGMPALFGPFEDTLIGGVNSGEGNIIAHNNGTGIAVIAGSFNGNPFSPTENISILGNSIHSNLVNSTGYIPSESGLGIDLLAAEFSDNTSTTVGPTPNDPGDVDSGPNKFMNFPVLNSVEQSSDTAKINFSLDAADGENDQYRVEFFSNDSADPSGYGEGQTFLGAATVTNGENQITNLSLPSGTNLLGKAISATTTAVDSNAVSGFSSTSEFSRVVVATRAQIPSSGLSGDSPSSSQTLANTGQAAQAVIVAALVLIAGAGFMSRRYLRKS